MYTASSLFLRTLADAGITHAFVNWGSDHPGLLEDLERQRTESADGTTEPVIVTCPNEMVALSAAQGYAQVTGKPAAVIVHVDVGTQALAGAVHNVDRSRTPVLIYAGASPFSSLGEKKGTRNEWIMWLQDVPDQSAIVRQYMRHTVQINSGSTIPHVVRRAVQISTSEPKGPVYLWARREVMEEPLSQSHSETPSAPQNWHPIEPSALSPSGATTIASALLAASNPLIITSYLGRTPTAVPALQSLAKLLAIPIVSTCPSAVNVPFSDPHFAGVSFLAPGTHSPHLHTADVILVINSSLPWIPMNDVPPSNARVFVLDSGDPLNLNIGSWHVDAELICRADAEVALQQIIDASRAAQSLEHVDTIQARAATLAAAHEAMVKKLDHEEATYPSSLTPDSRAASITVPNILGVLRHAIQDLTPSHGAKTLYLNESISNFPLTWMHLRPDVPGSMLSSGGSSLGWSLGAAVGARLGGEVAQKGYDLIVVIVGDGSFLFGVPASVYWMARKYNTPFLTIVLNNGGWKSPKMSLLGVHPVGHGSQAPGSKLSVGFGPHPPDYAQIGVAASAGWTWGTSVGEGSDGKDALEKTIAEAVRVVLEEKRCVIVDCNIDSIG